MKNLSLFLSLILVFNVNLYSGITIYYVKYNSTGSNDGTSWADAYTSFQSALTAGVSGDQIWVANGTYKPTIEVDGSGDRFKTFQMKNNVAIYGGFAGSENAVSERTNFGAGQANETILSGDIGTEGDNTDNCYHVFYHPAGLGLTSSALLDGFTIKDGNANGGDGGGMFNELSSPTITNCTFTLNSAYFAGGMFNSSSSPTITNCIFSSNSASYGGGGMCNGSSSPTITNCVFSSNSASDNSGGISNWNSSPTLNNCTITSNSASYSGGISNSGSSSLTLNNCITWGNEAAGNGNEFYNDIDGGTTTLNYSCYANEAGDVYIGAGTFTATNSNITSDPQFVGPSINPNHPYSILGISPCVDAGNDSYNFQVYDIRGVGYLRKLNKTTVAVGTIDMGAYEYKLNDDPLPVELTSFTASANGAAVMLNWKTATEVNNYGFEVERRKVFESVSIGTNETTQLLNGSTTQWLKIGFVKGSGTSNVPKEYSYSDAIGSTGRYVYRLKQVDNDDSFKYSQSVEVTTQAPEHLSLAQNYPNPFNPTTNISFSITSQSFVSLKVFDVIGREVVTIVSEEMSAGSYSKQWNAIALPSGVYFYKLQAGNFIQTKKMILLK